MSAKASRAREFQSLAVLGKKTVGINTLAASRNGDRKIIKSTRIASRPSSRKKEMKPVELSQFK